MTLAPISRTTTSQQPPPRGGLWYRVEAGDTLSSISRRSKVSLKHITEANNLRSSTIKPGQRLFLPGAVAIGSDPLAGILDKREVVDQSFPEAPSGGYVIVRRKDWYGKDRA